jgi:hypothetical protein
MYQLLKMPMLIEHYFDHRGENKDLTLFQYLNIHYSNPHPKDSNDAKDKRLPFKSTYDCASAISGNYILTETFALERPESEEPKKQAVYKNQFLLNNLFTKIWQPPRTRPYFSCLSA